MPTDSAQDLCCPVCGSPPRVTKYPGNEKEYVSSNVWRCGTRFTGQGSGYDISQMCYWTFQRFADYEEKLRAAQRRPWWRWWR